MSPSCFLVCLGVRISDLSVETMLVVVMNCLIILCVVRCGKLSLKCADLTNAKSPERLGVGRVSNVDGIVMAHHIYHFLKHSRWEDVVRCRTLSDIESLREAGFRFGIACRG